MENGKLENAVVNLEEFVADLTRELSKEENQNKPAFIPVNELIKNKTTEESLKECIDLTIKQSVEETANEILEEYGEENIENILEELGKLRIESEAE